MAQTVGVFAEWLRANAGNEESDPAKVASVGVELAGRRDAPLRLVLSARAYHLAQEAAHTLATSDEQWRKLSESVSETVVSA